jgi:hypothetical protein
MFDHPDLKRHVANKVKNAPGLRRYLDGRKSAQGREQGQ